MKHWNLGICVVRRCPGKINSDADRSIWLYCYVNNTYIVHCNEVRRYGKKEAETGEHLIL